jgi:hypothetical protein
MLSFVNNDLVLFQSRIDTSLYNSTPNKGKVVKP